MTVSSNEIVNAVSIEDEAKMNFSKPHEPSLSVSTDGKLIEQQIASPASPSVQENAPYDPWAVQTLDDARRNEGSQPSWVIEGLLMSQSPALVSAHPKGMKSLSWLAASMEAVATRKIWGHFDAPNVDSTLFIETEDPSWLVEARIRGLAEGLELNSRDQLDGFHYICPGPFELLKEESRLGDLIANHKPKFIVLSTLQNLLQGGTNWSSQADMQPLLALIVRLSREAPIVLVTHSPWDQRQRRAAGTITQAANFATALHYLKAYSKELGPHVEVTTNSKAGMGNKFVLKLETSGDRSNPGSIRRLTYVGSPKTSKKDVILAEIEGDPDASNIEVAERAGVTERYVQQIRKETKPKRRSRK
jgi:hypothetical protein